MSFLTVGLLLLLYPVDTAAQKKPRLQQFVVPAGTTLSIEVRSALRSDGSKPAEQVTGRLVLPLASGGTTVVPAGAPVMGSIAAVEPADRSAPGRIELQFHVIEHPETRSKATIRTTGVTVQGERLKKKKRFGVTAVELTDARLEPGTVVSCSLLAPLVVFIPYD